jgi:hypothetical protein
MKGHARKPTRKRTVFFQATGFKRRQKALKPLTINNYYQPNSTPCLTGSFPEWSRLLPERPAAADLGRDGFESLGLVGRGGVEHDRRWTDGG